MTFRGQVKVTRNFKCNISMINCLIALKFYTEVQSDLENIQYGQIRANKGKYNQIRANKAKCG